MMRLGKAPGRTLRAVFEDDAVIEQLLADTVCFGKVSGLFCGESLGDQLLDGFG